MGCLKAQASTKSRGTAIMATQILRTSGGSRMAEENLAAVESALMDLLSHGGAFAGLPHSPSRDLHTDCTSYTHLPYNMQQWLRAICQPPESHR